MPNLDELIKGKQAARLLGDKGKLEQLRDAPETRQIFSMLSRSTGDLESAAERAAKGDAAQLTDPPAHAGPGGGPAHPKDEGQLEIR